MAVGGVSYFVIGGVVACMFSVIVFAAVVLVRRTRRARDGKTLNQKDNQDTDDWKTRTVFVSPDNYIANTGRGGVQAEWLSALNDENNDVDGINLDWDDHQHVDVCVKHVLRTSSQDDDNDVSEMYSTTHNDDPCVPCAPVVTPAV